MRALLVSIVLLASAGVASANDAEKPTEPPPPPTVKLDPPARRPRPIAIHDSTRDANGQGKSCEPNAMGQLECKTSSLPNWQTHTGSANAP